MSKSVSSRWILGCWLALSVLSLSLSVFMYFHPGIFEMHGFSGPVDYTPYFSHIRLSGDSWRYLSGGSSLMSGGGLDGLQRGYSGYCLMVGVFGSGIVVVQVLVSLAGLWALLLLSCACWNESCAVHSGGWRLWAVLLCGGAFALNPENSAWHCAVMTESLYVSMVCVVTWLAYWAQKEHCVARMPAALAVTVATCCLRPTGWILLPAVLLYWCARAHGRLWTKLSGALLVVAMFFTVAYFCSSGINSQHPAEKLYSGEVVWQEDLWRVDMPAPGAGATNGIGDGLVYGLRHPVMSGWLVIKRLVVMFLRIRPSYSLAHNVFLLLFHLPVAVFGIASLIAYRTNGAVSAVCAVVLAHSLVVALTFNDNDGRFTLYFTPVLATAAIVLAIAMLKKISLAICK